MTKSKLNLVQTVELYRFLQGEVPPGIMLKSQDVPKLSADQAWSVIWHLGNLYAEVNDEIERCDVCKKLYDTASDGECLDYGDPPYHFCSSCWNGEEANTKRSQIISPTR